MTLERDIELIFKILRKIVSSEPTELYGKHIKIENYGADVIGYHLYLMVQVGLIKGTFPKSIKGPIYSI